MTGVPLWAQAESEAVRRMWVEAWGLLEDARAFAADAAHHPTVDDFEAMLLRDRIERFLRQATATEPTTEAECPSCPNCGATDLSDNPTTCGACGTALFDTEPAPPRPERHLRSIAGGEAATTKGKP